MYDYLFYLKAICPYVLARTETSILRLHVYIACIRYNKIRSKKVQNYVNSLRLGKVTYTFEYTKTKINQWWHFFFFKLPAEN